MKPIILLFSLIVALGSAAQTKLIAFKSHSGDMNRFYHLVAIRAAEMEPHNLGAAPMKIVQTAQLDTVVYVDDTTTIMITSTYCQDQYDPGTPPWIWSPGKDTLINDEVWNREDPDAIKKDLKKDFNFRNDMDSVVFIGFPEKEKEEEINKNREAGGYDENEEVAPPVSRDNSPGMGVPIAIIGVALMAILIVLISWRKSHFKQSELA